MPWSLNTFLVGLNIILQACEREPRLHPGQLRPGDWAQAGERGGEEACRHQGREEGEEDPVCQAGHTSHRQPEIR